MVSRIRDSISAPTAWKTQLNRPEAPCNFESLLAAIYVALNKGYLRHTPDVWAKVNFRITPRAIGAQAFQVEVGLVNILDDDDIHQLQPMRTRTREARLGYLLLSF